MKKLLAAVIAGAFALSIAPVAFADEAAAPAKTEKAADKAADKAEKKEKKAPAKKAKKDKAEKKDDAAK